MPEQSVYLWRRRAASSGGVNWQSAGSRPRSSVTGATSAFQSGYGQGAAPVLMTRSAGSGYVGFASAPPNPTGRSSSMTQGVAWAYHHNAGAVSGAAAAVTDSRGAANSQGAESRPFSSAANGAMSAFGYHQDMLQPAADLHGNASDFYSGASLQVPSLSAPRIDPGQFQQAYEPLPSRYLHLVVEPSSPDSASAESEDEGIPTATSENRSSSSETAAVSEADIVGDGFHEPGSPTPMSPPHHPLAPPQPSTLVGGTSVGSRARSPVESENPKQCLELQDRVEWRKLMLQEKRLDIQEMQVKADLVKYLIARGRSWSEITEYLRFLFG
ncbi:hypothetical protein HDU96_008613 [Phlyctochytrium bullatum]|nr:hypothetical protein HDU96_008613 [Phlyctochytrium bullatum]